MKIFYDEYHVLYCKSSSNIKYMSAALHYSVTPLHQINLFSSVHPRQKHYDIHYTELIKSLRC